jgi:hypothetical protein
MIVPAVAAPAFGTDKLQIALSKEKAEPGSANCLFIQIL